MPKGGRGRLRLARLAVVLFAPTLVLTLMWRWSASYVGSDEGEPPEIYAEPDEPGFTALGTSLLSMRRVPDVIIADIRVRADLAATAPYRRTLTELMDDESCALVSDGDGTPLYQHRPDDEVIPASNQKLLVAAAAAEVLDATARLQTSVFGTEPVEGVVNGDLRLVGGGDPLLSTEEYATKTGISQYEVATLEGLAEQLKVAGVTTIAGDVVGDDARYDRERRNPTWTPQITAFDVAPLSALVVNNGLDGGGSVPDDAALTAATIFRSVLVDTGIEVGGTVRSLGPDEARGLGSDERLATVESPPIAEIIRHMLLVSDNLSAELLVKEIGRVARGEGTTAAGLESLEAEISQQEDASDAVLVDGSGLSYENRVSCDLLVEMFSDEVINGELVDDLPIAARTGTLAEFFQGTPAAGVLRAKTGTLFGVKALSGVSLDASGDEVYFSVILNRPNAKDDSVFRPVWDATAALIATAGRELDVDRSDVAPRPLWPDTSELTSTSVAPADAVEGEGGGQDGAETTLSTKAESSSG